MDRSRQQVVETTLRRIVKKPDFPIFGQHLAEVVEVVANDESSMRHITNVILKDYGLTLNVLRTANSLYYNRSGRGIVTVTHAVTLLGLEAIRDLAGSMLLFQHFRKKSAGLRELALLSLLTACHARVTAKRIEYPRIEEVYLCGMFRNLGEILVASYLPRKHTTVLARMKEFSVSESEACLGVLECKYEDLGRAAARHWKMPENVRHCMRNDQPRLTNMHNTEFDILRALVSFSHGLTESIHRRDPRATNGRLDYLLMSHGPLLSLARGEIQEIADEAIDETKFTFDVLKIPLDDLRLRRQTELALQSIEEPEEEPEPNASDGGESGESLLERLTEEVELMLCAGGANDITKLILTVLESIYRGAHVSRVVFALVSADHQSVQGRLGLGPDVEEFLAEFHFPMSIRSGPVAVALLSKNDLYIQDGRYADSEFGRLTNAPAFGLLPVVVDGVTVGGFYFDHPPDAEPLTDGVKHLLARLRSLTAEAIRNSRDREPVSA